MRINDCESAGSLWVRITCDSCTCTRSSFGMPPLASGLSCCYELWIRKVAYSAADFMGKNFPCAWDNCKNYLFVCRCRRTVHLCFWSQLLWRNCGMVRFCHSNLVPTSLCLCLFYSLLHRATCLSPSQVSNCFLPYAAACSWSAVCKMPGRGRGAGTRFKIK